MNKKLQQEYEIKIRQLLYDVSLVDRIAIIERLGMKLRQQNSIETNRETNEFIKKGLKYKNG